MNVKQRIAIEKRIADYVVTNFILREFTISVSDGEETVLPSSNNRAEVLAAMFTTDENTLSFSKNGIYYGTIYFVYGNDGFDVMSDHSFSSMEALELMTAILKWVDNGLEPVRAPSKKKS